MSFPIFRPLVLLHFVFSVYPIRAQVVATDPWLITDPDVILENTHAAIVANRVVCARSFTCRSGKQVDDMRHLEYEVRFDSLGYPVEVKNGAAVRAESKERNAKDKRFGRKWIGASEFLFEYRPDHQIQCMQAFRWSSEFSRDEEEVHYVYDPDGRLVEQHRAERTIYAPGYSYRGTSYPNTTTFTDCTIDHHEGTHATCIVHEEGSSRSDTLVTEIAEIDDSMPTELDGITECLLPVGHAKTAFGECLPLYSPTHLRIRSIYEGGVLHAKEVVDGEDQVLSRTNFEYNDKGLLKRVSQMDGTNLRWMSYVFVD